MELHEKYAPILRFNKAERFFPLRVDDFLAQCALHARDSDEPIVKRGQVTPDRLVRLGSAEGVFLRSVRHGPLRSQDVVSEWSEGALEMAYRWAAASRSSLTDRLARKAYGWFSPKTARAARLFWWNDLVRHVLDDQLTSSPEGQLPRLTLPASTHDSAIEEYADRRPDYAYYYRQIRDGNYLCLQYWFFYSYNDWGRQFAGMNDHEGDWEGLTLFFRLDDVGRPQEPPAYITFADHDSCQTKSWDHPDVTIVGTHPVGFVGAGSHATYPECKVHPLMEIYALYDYANGDGFTIDHDDWSGRIDLDTVPWLRQYAGSWGTRFWLPTKDAQDILRLVLGATPFAGLTRHRLPDNIELPGVSAPRGPLGAGRQQVASPVAWAGLET